MKQNSGDESTVKITKFPCTTVGPCLEGEEDYDPCAEGHDITEKDLEILSKIEDCTRKAEAESKYKKEEDKGNGKGNWDKEKVGGSSKQEDSGKNIKKDNGKNSKSSRKVTDESTTKGRVNLDRETETVGDDDATAAAASTIKPKRKVCHKKVKKNPFHRDRLALPSCASPPLHSPPPQLHPPTEEFEDAECPTPKKSKKTKPCRKKNVIRGIKSKSKGKSKIEVQEEAEQEEVEQEEAEQEEAEQEPEEQHYEETEEEEIKEEADKSVEEIKSDTESKAETSEERISKAGPMKRSTEEKSKNLGKFVLRNRKPCTKPIQRPCKKKVSQISISLLPPLIPPLQRDLPSICPKNIPEVQRQTLMAKETQRMVKRERCKSRLANKAKNK